MARVLNRAYARLNQVLSLAGSQIVADIDLDQVFPVHELAPVIQASVVDRYTFVVSSTQGGAANVHLGLDPTTTPFAFSAAYRNGQIYTPSPLDGTELDILYTGFGASRADATVDSFFLYKDLAGTTVNYAIPITALLDNFQTIEAAGDQVALDLSNPYYECPMPFLLKPEFEVKAKIVFSGAGSAGVVVEALVGPKGVFQFVRTKA